MCKRVVTQSVQERFLCCTLPPPPTFVKVAVHGWGGERSQLLLLYELYVFFFCFFWHMNPLHWRNTLWNWSISLTANYTPTGTISLWSIIPSGFILMFLYIVFYLLSRPGFTYNPTGTISIPFIIPTGFIALSESECAGTELRLRHVC